MFQYILGLATGVGLGVLHLHLLTKDRETRQHD
jgi:hypothetical protein